MTFPAIYLDCDGVLANFDKLAIEILGCDPREFERKNGTDEFWSRLKEYGRFYYDLELLPDAMELYEAVKDRNPIILTGSPSHLGEEAREDKVQWVEKMFGPRQQVIVCQSKKKSVFCRPGDVIVDDWPRHREKWVNAGGIWIHHVSAKSSIEALKDAGFL